MTAKKSPSESLSAAVVDRLILSGLVRSEKRDTLIATISSGSMKGEDWKLEIDIAKSKVEQR